MISARARCCSTVAIVSLVTLFVAAAPPANSSLGRIVEPSTDVAASAPAPLHLVSTTVKGPRLTELEFSTPYLPRTTRVRVLTPVGYDDDPGRRWPVLLLLAGCCDDTAVSEVSYAGWTDQGNAEEITQPGQFLVVMPAGGAGGWYSDHYGLVGEGGPRWESYHIGQLLPWVDSHYRTTPARDARAVAGLSMGGFGALSYAARHPDVFSFVQSYSGAVDPTQQQWYFPVPTGEVDQALGVAEGRPPSSVWGPWATEEVRTRAHAPIDLVGNLRHTDVTLRVGDGTDGRGNTVDRVEASEQSQNNLLHEALTRAAIPHTYDAYGAGTHSWEFWSRDLEQAIEPLNAHFSSVARGTPASFSYTWAEESASVYGYELQSDRGFLEFATLDVSPGQIGVTGSGVFTITTPAQYTPRSPYRLTATRSGRTEETIVVADTAGRLSLRIDTASRSTGQEYRPSSATRKAQVQISLRPQ